MDFPNGGEMYCHCLKCVAIGEPSTRFDVVVYERALYVLCVVHSDKVVVRVPWPRATPECDDCKHGIDHTH